MKKKALFAALVFAMAATTASARTNLLQQAIDAAQSATDSAPAGTEASVGFSPEGSAIRLVMRGINSARSSIHVMAYVMSNRQIIDALAGAARRGLDVRVVVDYKQNIEEDRGGYIRRQLGTLAASGAKVCTVDQFRIMHDKVMILDNRSIQTGSFNYTKAGATDNSENALILWNVPSMAANYEQHFASRFAICHALQ